MWLMLVVALVAAVFGAGLLLRQQSRRVIRKTASLLASPGCAAEPIDFAELDPLPDVVQRYLRHVLVDRQRRIRMARMLQRGVLRTSTRSARWLSFDAEQLIAPLAKGFLWVARIRLFPCLNLQVCDSFVAGRGGGELRLFSTLRIAAERGRRELDEAALHRYLAEAVWSPTALLPSSGVHWSALDTESALASIEVAGIRVSLEFRFNSRDEVCSIHTPGRWMRTKGGYRKLPWRGRFADYSNRNGMIVPLFAEVAWFDNSDWQPVWQGHINKIEHVPA